MMRCIGKSDEPSDSYVFPDCGEGTFGKYGMQIYQSLDLRCRALAKQVMAALGKSEICVDDILDPIHTINDSIDENIAIAQNGKHISSLFMPFGYVSSSIMDNFHYFAPSHEKHEKFYNNHSAHTDSGLMTVVIITDEPGLEILDQKMEKWVRIEQLMQEYLKESGECDSDVLCHRRYATFFWSDSVEYLNNAPCVLEGSAAIELKPLFHRVADCEHERYSVVFKQRTAPLRTHCRYQEDYVLASIQRKVDTQSKNAYTLWEKKQNKHDFWLYVRIFVALFAFAAVCMNNYLNLFS